MSTTILANIDLTNRCNLRCSFCFANAFARGYVYEPTFDEIVEMLRVLREEQPVPCPAVQFSGGEPTLRSDLVDLIRTAKEMGFVQVQLATNGIILGQNEWLAKQVMEAGLSTVYLHFDGVTKDLEPLLDLKIKAIEHCRKVKQGMVLVPTIINGYNDHQIGDIIRFAAKNVDVIRGVNFQPISFTGAMPSDQREQQRFTVPDLAERMEAQTGGAIMHTDLYPIPCVIPISKFIELHRNKPQIEFSAHPHCGAATYLFVGENGKLTPINRFVDVEGFFKVIEDSTDKLKNGGRLLSSLTMMRGVKKLGDCINENLQPPKVDLKKMLKKVLDYQDIDSLKEYHWNTLFIGCMHFQDAYNYDIERVRRCVIHYATPDPERRIIPFCAYNSGPKYREIIERKYSIPLDQWEKEHGKIHPYKQEE